MAFAGSGTNSRPAGCVFLPIIHKTNRGLFTQAGRGPQQADYKPISPLPSAPLLPAYLENDPLEFPLWLSRLRTWHSLCAGAGSILGLTQWAKDLALPQIVAQAANAAWLHVVVAVA